MPWLFLDDLAGDKQISLPCLLDKERGGKTCPKARQNRSQETDLDTDHMKVFVKDMVDKS
jgi:hypothetical protein